MCEKYALTSNCLLLSTLSLSPLQKRLQRALLLEVSMGTH